MRRIRITFRCSFAQITAETSSASSVAEGDELEIAHIAHKNRIPKGREALILKEVHR